ncbi:sugar ABC transporter ATP-binding protein [Georgenia alba]|uniref:Sugar ABC transporter ATP-binding protein n=1 Tax=Georgenia alba TaxID=2233858 RepID=A0ABW2Q8F8_9MICO
MSKAYPGTQALDDVDLDVGPGEVVALLGENGAGKSTLAGILAGLTEPSAGEMTWLGERYRPPSPGSALEAGVALIHQEMRLLPELSAAENVVIGRWPTGAHGFVDHRRLLAEAAEVLQSLGFQPDPETLVRHLSVAAQQQVEIAKALAQNAKLLILDEPTAALGQSETEALFSRIRELKERGHSFIYVSHRLAEIRTIADRIVVLRDGRKVAEHESSDVEVDRLVTEMVGRSVDRLFPRMPDPAEDVVLEVEGLTGADDRFRDVTFSVRAGEVVGIAGIVGAGRTELVRAIAGADQATAGSVRVSGRRIRTGSVPEAITNGVVLVPEDRRHHGLVADLTVGDNTMLTNFSKVMRHGRIDRSRVAQLGQRVINSMKIKGRSETRAEALSGGNQQKVVIGKWLELGPRVVLLDEPTRGIDVGARAAIYDVVRGLAEQGLAVVVVSSDLEEVMGLSHRIMVLAQGAQQGIIERSEMTPERIMALATV